MIVLEITDEPGVSLYEALGLTREGVKAARDATGDVRNAAKKKRKPYHVLSQKGDKDAREKLDRINEAEAILKDAKKREDYDKGLDSGKGASLEILRVRPAAPPVFTDRAARFRKIEEAMRRAGLAQPAWTAEERRSTS
jgi:DnaJ-class molecular chaperone